MSYRVLAPLVLAVAGCAAASTLSAQAAAVPDPIVRAEAIVQIGERTYLIPDGNVSLVPNVGIVVGDSATLVIDPGLGRHNGEIVAREVARLSGDRAIYVAATHYHAEHSTGFLGLPAGARYISSTVQQAEFDESGAQQIRSFSGRSPMTAALLADARVFEADIHFEREYTLDLGGVRVRFLVVGPTHTRGDTGFFVEGDDVLFTGDVVMNESFLAATQVSSMGAWLAAFDTFEALAPRVIVPAHGAAGDGSLIPANRAVMAGIQARAGALKAQGRSAAEAVTTVEAELRQRHPDWPRSNGIAAAVRSVYAEAP